MFALARYFCASTASRFAFDALARPLGELHRGALARRVASALRARPLGRTRRSLVIAARRCLGLAVRLPGGCPPSRWSTPWRRRRRMDKILRWLGFVWRHLRRDRHAFDTSSPCGATACRSSAAGPRQATCRAFPPLASLRRLGIGGSPSRELARGLRRLASCPLVDLFSAANIRSSAVEHLTCAAASMRSAALITWLRLRSHRCRLDPTSTAAEAGFSKPLLARSLSFATRVRRGESIQEKSIQLVEICSWSGSASALSIASPTLGRQWRAECTEAWRLAPDATRQTSDGTAVHMARYCLCDTSRLYSAR